MNQKIKDAWIIIGILFGSLSISAQTNKPVIQVELTNEPVIQVKFYSDTNAVSEVHYTTPGPFVYVYGQVENIFVSGKVLIMRELVSGYGDADPTYKEIVLENYPDYKSLTSGEDVDLQAQKVGTIRGVNQDGTPSSIVLELWDYYTVPELTPEQIAAAQKAAQEAAKALALANKKRADQLQSNAVRWLQSQATNGDADAQCDLGEHYLKGEGCETNRTLAIYWLKRSAGQGDTEASNKLSKLNPN